MLLEFGTAQDIDDVGAGASAAAATDCCLLDLVRGTFPELAIQTYRLDQSGGDHLLLVVNDKLAFRFPRAGMHDLRLEIEVLQQLRHRSSLQLPTYDYVDPDGRFGGYRFINGVPLTTERFGSLDVTRQVEVLADAVQFLIALHDLPQAEVEWSGDWPRTWTAAQFAARFLVERLPIMVAYVPQLAGPLEAFYESYRLDCPPHLAIVHGDLVCEHLLIDSARSSLAGIIDFGDVALGDPAQDLLGFWNYGSDAVARIVKRYDPCNNDPGLLHRSYNHFVRYRTDRLFETLPPETGLGTSERIAALQALLTTSTQYNR
ncbi:phosphotransferase family protein [Sphingomonas sp. BAUL-RG-20F-R05-02]|uniref:phosphotransferase family protein n=1 Tax=Sphingomonas sp. BAUL-RG-20F-R05-02 TaxID=2914830 RepID=UPI001F58E488|nr:aminoglycoside phosphotransferase family protein [Sphingomonas sp. BAUL-RG-20F-R05-02]